VCHECVHCLAVDEGRSPSTAQPNRLVELALLEQQSGERVGRVGIVRVGIVRVGPCPQRLQSAGADQEFGRLTGRPSTALVGKVRQHLDGAVHFASGPERPRRLGARGHVAVPGPFEERVEVAAFGRQTGER